MESKVEKEYVPHWAHNPPVHFYITYDASVATMATMSDFEEFKLIILSLI